MDRAVLPINSTPRFRFVVLFTVVVDIVVVTTVVFCDLPGGESELGPECLFFSSDSRERSRVRYRGAVSKPCQDHAHVPSITSTSLSPQCHESRVLGGLKNPVLHLDLKGAFHTSHQKAYINGA